MYVVSGATGHTGLQIAKALLAEGKQVRAIVRNAEKAQDLKDLGAELAVGSLEDAQFVQQATEGASVLYAMIPPNFGTDNFRAYQNRVADAFVGAIEHNKLTHVVVLSSIGAHYKDAGVVGGLYDFEQKLNAIEGLNALYLRAGFFMENLFGTMQVIKQAGVAGGFPIDGNIPMAIVATKDIADVATKAMLNPNFKGKEVTYVAGPEDLTLQQVATIIGTAIGKPELPFVNFGYEQAAAAMAGMGMLPTLVEGYTLFAKAANEGHLMGDYVPKPEYSNPTSLQDFLPALVAAYQQM